MGGDRLHRSSGTDRPPSFHFLTVADGNGPLSLRYADCGDTGGRPLLLLHGYGDSWFSFSGLRDHLPESLRLIIPDLRGHGESGKTGARHGRRDFVADALALLDHLGLDRPVTVIGHSLGAMTALRLAAERPERVARLFLIGAAATAADNPGLSQVLASLNGLTAAPDGAFIEGFQRSATAPAVPASFRDEIFKGSEKLPLAVWRQVASDLLDAGEDAELSHVRAPVRLIWGECDGVFSERDQRQLLEGLKDVALRRYPKAGHSPHWESPRRVAADLLDFLD